MRFQIVGKLEVGEVNIGVCCSLEIDKKVTAVIVIDEGPATIEKFKAPATRIQFTGPLLLAAEKYTSPL